MGDTDRVVNLEELAQVQVASMAAQIKGNKQLRHILKQAKPGLRREVFEELKPFLTFTPCTYGKLIQ